MTARQPWTPHPRGWTLVDGGIPEAFQVNPAPAGVDPGAVEKNLGVLRGPRTRGGGPLILQAVQFYVVWTLHPRGWTPSSFSAVAGPKRRPHPRGGGPGGSFILMADNGADPAHTGVDREVQSQCATRRGKPRPHGGGPHCYLRRQSLN